MSIEFGRRIFWLRVTKLKLLELTLIMSTSKPFPLKFEIETCLYHCLSKALWNLVLASKKSASNVIHSYSVVHLNTIYFLSGDGELTLPRSALSPWPGRTTRSRSGLH